MNDKKYGFADVLALLKDFFLGGVLFVGLFAITFVIIPNTLTYLVGFKICQPEQDALEFLFMAAKIIAVLLDLLLFLVYTWVVFVKSLCEFIHIPKICNYGEHKR
jgi:hypothetical protein